MEIKDRISELIADKGVTPYEIYVKTGVYQSTLSLILSGKTKRLNIRNSELLANYFGVTRSWLTTGEGERENTSVKSDVPAQTETVNDDIQKLKWTVEQLREANAELKREKDEAIREASKWQTLARQAQMAGPACVGQTTATGENRLAIMEVGYLNMELMAQDSEDYAREARGKKNRAKENIRIGKIIPTKAEFSIGDFMPLNLDHVVLEDWHDDPMVLPPGKSDIEAFKVIAAGIIQTIHKQTSEKNRFTLKNTWVHTAKNAEALHIDELPDSTELCVNIMRRGGVK